MLKHLQIGWKFIRFTYNILSNRHVQIYYLRFTTDLIIYLITLLLRHFTIVLVLYILLKRIVFKLVRS